MPAAEILRRNDSHPSIARRGSMPIDRCGASEPRIPGPIDLPHSARRQRRQDFVRAETRPGCQSHRIAGSTVSLRNDGLMPMTSEEVRRSRSPVTGARTTAIALGLAAAIAFALLAGVRLTAQGPQYDELHQAAGAFTWLGAPPPPAFWLDFQGVC